MTLLPCATSWSSPNSGGLQRGRVSTFKAVSAQLNNTTAKRPDIATQFLSQLLEVSQENGADIFAGDFNSAANCARGKAQASWTEATWEDAFLVLAPDLVPVW